MSIDPMALPSMETLARLEARIRALEDHQALHALKARYARAADSKYTPDGRRAESSQFLAAARAQAECFCEDAIWEGGPFGGDLVGRQAICDSFARAPWRHAMHFYQSPLIELDGDTATAQWLLWQMAVDDACGEVVLIGARTRETYRRVAGGWLISRMAFEKLHSICIAPDASALVCRIPHLSNPSTAPTTP